MPWDDQNTLWTVKNHVRKSYALHRKPYSQSLAAVSATHRAGKSKNAGWIRAKLDISVSDGFVRLEKQSFEAYNEAKFLIQTIENYKERTGYYPVRVLADKIYRNRENLAWYKEHKIRLSGPALGKPKKKQHPTQKTGISWYLRTGGSGAGIQSCQNKVRTRTHHETPCRNITVHDCIVDCCSDPLKSGVLDMLKLIMLYC